MSWGETLENKSAQSCLPGTGGRFARRIHTSGNECYKQAADRCAGRIRSKPARNARSKRQTCSGKTHLRQEATCKSVRLFCWHIDNGIQVTEVGSGRGNGHRHRCDLTTTSRRSAVHRLACPKHGPARSRALNAVKGTYRSSPLFGTHLLRLCMCDLWSCRRLLGRAHLTYSTCILRPDGRQHVQLRPSREDSACWRQQSRHQQSSPHVCAAMPSLQNLPWPGNMHVSVPSIPQMCKSPASYAQCSCNQQSCIAPICCKQRLPVTI